MEFLHISDGLSHGDVCPAGSYVFVGLLDIIMRAQCELADVDNQPLDVDTVDAEYDFIVVGAGAAGCVIANRLSEVLDWNVLLLEAGGHEPTIAQLPAVFTGLQGTYFDWQYSTEPQDTACRGAPGGRCRRPRGKTLGGTTLLNGMKYLRGNRKDYDTWESLGNVGWSYEDVLPYFIKSEDNGNLDQVDAEFHGIGGYLHVQRFTHDWDLMGILVEAGQEMGLEFRDTNGKRQTGIERSQMTTKNGARFSASKAFLNPIRLRPNLHISLHSHVTKVLVDPVQKHAYGVEFMKKGVVHTVRVSKEVILSAGSVNSPQILMLSGIGPQEDLTQLGVPVIEDLRVGYNLQEHIGYDVELNTNQTAHPISLLDSSFEFALHREGPLASRGLGEITAFVSTKFVNPDEDYPDLKLDFSEVPTTCYRNGSVISCSHFTQIANFAIVPTLMRPKSRGAVKLASADPLDKPLIYANFLSHPDDIAVIIEGIKIAFKMADTSALRKVAARVNRDRVPGCRGHRYDTYEYWTCALRQRALPENHMCGTNKMGPDTDPDAVVDPQLRVYGVSGLRVIDASVLPSIPSSNIMGVVYMVGEKGSDLIKEQWL